MFAKIKSAYLWAKMMKMYRAEDYVGAAVIANKYRETTFNNAAFRAFDATLDILNKRSDIAKTKFYELSEYLKTVPGNDSKYIGLYCEYYFRLIDNCPDAEDIRKEAKSVAASNHIRKWLPLPNEEIPI